MPKAYTGTTLCLDFGNTKQKVAFFDGHELLWIENLEQANLEESLENLIERSKPGRTILSSVINHSPAIEEIINRNGWNHVLNAGSKLNFTTPVGKPETIGADRLALCAAAVERFPKMNNLVIGLGTAVTYNFINVKNEFLGGGISPGLYMRMKALNTYTAKLPIIAPQWHVPLVGYDTATNIQSGVILGMAYEIQGMIEAYARRYGAFNVHLTGGDLGFLSPHIKSLIFADPDLLFKGLYAICNQNYEAG